MIRNVYLKKMEARLEELGDDIARIRAKAEKAEEGAITLYKEIIALADKEGDAVTVSLFTDILAEEEEHHNQFSTLLED